PRPHGENESGRAASRPVQRFNGSTIQRMSVETRRDGDGRRSGCCARFLAAATAISTGAASRPNHRRREMNVLTEMLPALDDLKKRFAGRLDAVPSPRASEIYVHAKMDLVAGFTAY